MLPLICYAVRNLFVNLFSVKSFLLISTLSIYHLHTVCQYIFKTFYKTVENSAHHLCYSIYDIIKATMARKKEGLTKRDKEMVKLYVADPKMTKSEAWRRTHDSTTDNITSIRSQATQAFSSPEVRTELAKYSSLTEDVLLNDIQEFRTSEKQWERSLANDTSRWIHDKVHGKATQPINQQVTAVSINIDLTQ